MLRRSLWLLLLPLLAACGPRYIWVKDISQDELNRDRYECERDMRAGAMSFGTGIVGQINADEFMGRCFQAKGYRRVDANEAQRQNEPGPDWYANNLRLCNQSCAANNLGEACYGRCRMNWQK